MVVDNSELTHHDYNFEDTRILLIHNMSKSWKEKKGQLESKNTRRIIINQKGLIHLFENPPETRRSLGA
jgi:hypothetical protein